MKRTLSFAAALALTAGLANAQFKVPPKQQQPTAPVAPAGTLTSPQAQQQQQSLAAVRRIVVEDAYDLWKEKKVVFVDVRSKEKYDLGHIKGAISIPGSQLLGRLRELPPGKMIITYCACSAEQSSGHAVIELNNHGVKNTAALLGGWHEWENKKLPVEVTKR